MVVDGKVYHSVTNIGTRPSVDRESRVTVETFVIDFEGDIYGENVRLEVYQYLRPIQKFQGIEEVWEQVKKDIENAKKYLDMVEPK
jgi:riboflavin kinase/FMN adenylyltransferase